MMESCGPFDSQETLAIAVSGGPDSMALTRLAHTWAEKCGHTLVGLTVDHRLREAAKEEAYQVAEWFRGLDLDHHTLTWEEGASVGQLDRSPQAAARDARFSLISTWCDSHDVRSVLVAHHADDQAETFLQRLIRGSGVDGLAAMAQVSLRNDIRILRPLLDRPKTDLIATCEKYGQPWLNDPSNQDHQFTRVRLRTLLAELEEEGLDRDRLLETVGHLQRAKDAIDSAVEHLSMTAVMQQSQDSVHIDLTHLLAAPEEVGLRCLARHLARISGADYPPRFDSLMRVYRALGTAEWTDRTLHGCQLRLKATTLTMSKEARERQNSG